MKMLPATAILAAIICLWPGAGLAEPMEDSAGLFSFEAPAGWRFQSQSTETESQVRADRVEEGVYLTISARPQKPDLAWPDWEAQLKKSLGGRLKGAKFGPYAICGAPGLAAVGQSSENQATTIEMVAVLKHQVGYVLTMAYPGRDWSRHRAVFQGILASLKCLAP